MKRKNLNNEKEQKLDWEEMHMHIYICIQNKLKNQ
jgi:hypothetical protein